MRHVGRAHEGRGRDALEAELPSDGADGLEVLRRHIDRHVEIGPIVRGSDLHEQLVTSLLVAGVRGWRELPTGGA